MSDITTIKVTKTVREELKKMGRKGQTYNDIIKLLMKPQED